MAPKGHNSDLYSNSFEALTDVSTVLTPYLLHPIRGKLLFLGFLADTTQLLTTSNFIGPWYHAALLFSGLGSIVISGEAQEKNQGRTATRTGT